MFALLLVLLLLAAAIHFWRSADHSAPAAARLALLYLLVGYCGIPMIVVSLGVLGGVDLRGGTPRGLFSEEIGLQFAAVALFAMAVATLCAVRYRGGGITVAAIGWAIYWLGATAVHLLAGNAIINMGHDNVIMVFVSHGLIGVLLAIALAISGEWKRG